MLPVIITDDDHHYLSSKVKQLIELLGGVIGQNASFSDRYKKRIRRLTLAKYIKLDDGADVLKIHSRVPNSSEFKLQIKFKSPSKVELDFEIGYIDSETFKILKNEVVNLIHRVEESIARKGAGFSTKNWNGLYIYRGEILEDSRFYKNYEEAVRQNITSSQFIESMKQWGFYFRDY